MCYVLASPCLVDVGLGSEESHGYEQGVGETDEQALLVGPVAT